MALHFVLKVNDYAIGSFVAQRTTDNGSTPDAVNSYDITIDTPDWEHDDVIEHRYGDGAWVLVRKALDSMEAAVQASQAGGL